MRRDRVGPDEDLNALSARLRVPGCMLLRANRLYSASWLTSGREIDVPEGDFCRTDRFVCPMAAVRLSARGDGYVCRAGDTPSSVAAALGVPRRLVLLAGRVAPGERLALPGPDERGRVVTALPGDTVAGLAGRLGVSEARLRRINRLWGEPLPGMRIMMPRSSGGSDPQGGRDEPGRVRADRLRT